MISIEDGVCKLYNDKKDSILSIKMNSNKLIQIKIDKVQVSLSVEQSIKKDICLGSSICVLTIWISED